MLSTTLRCLDADAQLLLTLPLLREELTVRTLLAELIRLPGLLDGRTAVEAVLSLHRRGWLLLPEGTPVSLSCSVPVEFDPGSWISIYTYLLTTNPGAVPAQLR